MIFLKIHVNLTSQLIHTSSSSSGFLPLFFPFFFLFSSSPSSSSSFFPSPPFLLLFLSSVFRFLRRPDEFSCFPKASAVKNLDFFSCFKIYVEAREYQIREKKKLKFCFKNFKLWENVLNGNHGCFSSTNYASHESRPSKVFKDWIIKSKMTTVQTILFFIFSMFSLFLVFFFTLHSQSSLSFQLILYSLFLTITTVFILHEKKSKISILKPMLAGMDVQGQNWNRFLDFQK